MLSVLDPCDILRVQSWDIRKAAPPNAAQVLRVVWPKSVGEVAHGAADVLCIGPTDWLVMAPPERAAALLVALQMAFQDSSFRVTDVSSALARVRVEGPRARLLLSKGCALDLDPQAFTPGRALRTRFAGMPVVVHCTQPAAFECIVSLSYRDYLLSWLEDAAAEFLPRRRPAGFEGSWIASGASAFTSSRTM